MWAASNFLKSIMPAGTRRLASRLRRRLSGGMDGAQRDWPRLIAEWVAAQATTVDLANHGEPRRLLIVPADYRTFSGSRGDDAMLSALIAEIGRAWRNIDIAALTATDFADAAAKEMRVRPLRFDWQRPLARTVLDLLGAERPDAVVVLGADMIDGHYSLIESAHRLLVADLAARSGIPTTILGGSFNSHPAPQLKTAFAALHEGVVLHIRDPVSLARFRAFAARPADLVADMAFLLDSSASGPIFENAKRWAAGRRAAGRLVLGFNAHPGLFSGGSEKKLKRFLDVAGQALPAAAAESRASWMLIPHEIRDNSDESLLARLAEKLEVTLGPDLLVLNGRPRAAVIKAVAGLTDGVVTGRLHLAIAALAMGVPACAITYQGKFEGLFQQFGLPADLLLRAEEALDGGRLEALVRGFALRLPALRRQVEAGLPDVHRLAALNLSTIPGAEWADRRDEPPSVAAMGRR